MDVESVTAASDAHAAGISRAAPWRVGAALWCLGMPGIAAVLWAVLPLLAAHPQLLPVPVWAVVLFTGLVAAGLLAGAVALGVALAPHVGLASPVVSAWAQGRPMMAALKPQLAPAVCGALVGAAGWWVLGWVSLMSPHTLHLPSSGSAMPWAAKLLYGGVTQEVFVRWGLMTLLLWWGSRWVQRDEGAPRSGRVVGVVGAVVASALLFALAQLAQLAAADATAGGLTAQAVVGVLVGHIGWGLIAGGLYARYGLEAALIAHVLVQALSGLLC